MKFMGILFCCLLAFSHLFGEIRTENSLLTRNQLFARGVVKHDFFVLNTVPKCGTHFIMTCIFYMLNKSVDAGYDYVTESQYTNEQAKNYLNFLNSLKTQTFIHKTHVPYLPKIEKTFLEADCKWLLFIRDPRDSLISLVFYLDTFQGDQRDFMWINSNVYDKLSFDDKITALMTGSCCTNYLDVFYRKITNWHTSKYGLMIKFEDLIGPNGGGTKAAQLESIQKISDYLNVNLSQQEVEAIGEYCFIQQPDQLTSQRTYKRSQIGSWKKFFNSKNKTLFKELFGVEIIELGYEQDNNW